MHEVVIVGGGIAGLCAAFHLRRRGCRNLVVLDRFAAGHAHGSSHGESRITRSSYPDRRYVALAARAHREGWPLLECELGAPLRRSTPGVFFGPPTGPFGAFLAATLGACREVERVDVDTARRAFPLLRIDDGDAVLRDHTAALLAAATTMQGLRDWLRRHDVELRQPVVVGRPRPEEAAIALPCGATTLRTRRLLVAAGAWTGDLVPGLRPQLTVLRQQVGYVAVAAPAAATAVGTFPVWARIGHGDEFDYGLPEFGRPGLKLARHRTTGPADDPDAVAATVDDGALLALARTRLRPPVRGLHGSETCLYTVAPGEHLTVAPHADDARIVVMTTCSGHGFKFAPVLGADAADLLGVG